VLDNVSCFDAGSLEAGKLYIYFSCEKAQNLCDVTQHACAEYQVTKNITPTYEFGHT
jgi:hypothetical protein